jgi:hypothetical protein
MIFSSYAVAVLDKTAPKGVGRIKSLKLIVDATNVEEKGGGKNKVFALKVNTKFPVSYIVNVSIHRQNYIRYAT